MLMSQRIAANTQFNILTLQKLFTST